MNDNTTAITLSSSGSVLEVAGNGTIDVLVIGNSGAVVELNGGNLTVDTLTASSGFKLQGTQPNGFTIPALTLTSGKIHIVSGHGPILLGGTITLNGGTLQN